LRGHEKSGPLCVNSWCHLFVCRKWVPKCFYVFTSCLLPKFFLGPSPLPPAVSFLSSFPIFLLLSRHLLYIFFSPYFWMIFCFFFFYLFSPPRGHQCSPANWHPPVGAFSSILCFTPLVNRWFLPPAPPHPFELVPPVPIPSPLWDVLPR